jgi:D-alanyl-D-alanine carboxypeptidase (penicillin-binding protein 5/6)
MLDFGFANYAISLGDEAGTQKGTVKIFKGEKEEVPVMVKSQINLLSSKNKTVSMESKLEILSALNAPVAKGAKAGEIVYFFEGREVGRSDLVTAEDVGKATLRDNVTRLYWKWFK